MAYTLVDLLQPTSGLLLTTLLHPEGDHSVADEYGCELNRNDMYRMCLLRERGCTYIPRSTEKDFREVVDMRRRQVFIATLHCHRDGYL